MIYSSEKVFSFGLTLDGDHTEEFNNAVAIALLKAPLKTLSALNVIDGYDVRDGYDARENNRLIHRFDTYSICGLPFVINYDKESLNRYYQHAIQVLKKSAHKNSQFCLHTMEAAMEEIMADDARGTMKWGTLTYPTP